MMASSTSPSTRWFWLEPLAAHAGRGAQVALDRLRAQVDRVELVERVGRASGTRHRAGHRAQARRELRSDGPRLQVAVRRALPASEAAEAGGADHRPVVGAQAGPRHHERDAQLRGARRDPLPQHAVGGHAAAHDDGPGADRLGGAQRPGREHVHDRVLERPGELGDHVRRAARSRRARRSSGAGPERVGDRAPRGGLEAAEAEVAAVAQPGPREAAVVPGGAGGGGHDGRAARIRQAQQPADLVERLARRVVDRLAQQPVVQVVAPSRPGTCGRR